MKRHIDFSIDIILLRETYVFLGLLLNYLGSLIFEMKRHIESIDIISLRKTCISSSVIKSSRESHIFLK